MSIFLVKCNNIITNTLWYMYGMMNMGWELLVVWFELEQVVACSIKVVYYSIGSVFWSFIACCVGCVISYLYVMLYRNNESFYLIWDMIVGLFELEQVVDVYVVLYHICMLCYIIIMNLVYLFRPLKNKLFNLLNYSSSYLG